MENFEIRVKCRGHEGVLTQIEVDEAPNTLARNAVPHRNIETPCVLTIRKDTGEEVRLYRVHKHEIEVQNRP